MKISRDRLKEIVKEVITEDGEYQDFFKRALEKVGKSIPDMSDEEKKSFFNKIDAAWNAKGEQNEVLTGDQDELDVDSDGDIEADDLADLRAGKKADESINEGISTSTDKSGNVNIFRDGKSLVAILQRNGELVFKVKKSNLTRGELNIINNIKDFITAKRNEFKNEANINEVSGYTLKKRDKAIVGKFVLGYYKDAQSLYKSGAYSVEKKSKGWTLQGPGGTHAMWKDGKLFYGQAYGNVSQTLINMVKKIAKQNGIETEYANLQRENINEVSTTQMIKDIEAAKTLEDVKKSYSPSNPLTTTIKDVNKKHGGLGKFKRELINQIKSNKGGKAVESVNEAGETEFEAFYHKKKVIVKSSKGIWDAKQQAFKLLNVPKSKQGLVAIQSMKSKANQDFKFN